MTLPDTVLPDELREPVETLWSYHDMGHDVRPCDVGIGLGSHDPGVAVVAVDLFRGGTFPCIVFTGANAPTTIKEFPRGEAVHYREYAVTNGVPSDAVLIETRATNTQENLTFTRQLLAANEIKVGSSSSMFTPLSATSSLRDLQEGVARS